MDGSRGTPATVDEIADRVLDRVGAFLTERRLWRPRGRLVVAVSGGANSLCLLASLLELQPARRADVRVVHVDHGFRPSSTLDAEHVRELARGLGVACEVIRVDGPGYARDHGLGVEHACRALRYRALATVAARSGARAILTGHTADDSVESFVMHLLRGAGSNGLRGIAPTETLLVGRLGPGLGEAAGLPAALARPLLEVRRAETAAYCRARGVTWRADPTNDDPAFLRNRVRHHLLPVLRAYNPAIDAALARTASVLRDEGAWLETLIERRWRSCRRGPGVVQIPLAWWRRQPRAARRRLLRRAASWLSGDGEPLDFAATERALAHLAEDRSGSMRLSRRLWLRRSGDQFELRRDDQP